MVEIREKIIMIGKVREEGIEKINEGKEILEWNIMREKMIFKSNRIIGEKI